MLIEFVVSCSLSMSPDAPILDAGPGPEETRLVTLDLDAVHALGEDSILRDVPLGNDLLVDLAVERFEVFAPDATLVVVGDEGERTLKPSDVTLLRGEVLGVPDSTVFLSLGGEQSHGFVHLDGRRYVLTTTDLGLITYDEAMVDLEWAPFECEARPLDDGLMRTMTPAPDGRGVPCRRIGMAVETDHELLANTFGGSTSLAMGYVETLFGAMTTIYTRDVGVRFELTFVRLWETADDPWTVGDSGGQLNEFRAYWRVNERLVERDLAHFLSSRNLGGGVAWVGTICSDYGYALSGNLAGSFPNPLADNHPQNWDPYVVAHEVGHNCGSPHTHDYSPLIDNCAGGECIADGTIMSYCHGCAGGMRNIQLRLHERVQDHVLAYMDTGVACPLELLDPTIVNHPVSQVVCEGEDATFLVIASGEHMSYRWLRNFVPLAGETSAVLQIEDVQPSDAGQYVCVVSNACGMVISEAASLEIGACGADLTGDCALDIFDVLAFLERFESQQADWNEDGTHDIFDVLAYLEDFEAGC